MTLRSRLSAAWRAFRQDDFPPTAPAFGMVACSLDGGEPQCVHGLPAEQCYIGPTRDCPTHGTLDMSPHPLPSMADECEAMRLEQERDIANVEVPAVIKKRKKLVSVPKE